MLLDFLIAVLVSFVNAILSLLPTFTFPSPNTTGGIFPLLGALGRVIPLSDIISIVLIALAIIIALYIWDALVFVYHQFWGSN